jgi:hypothetical protein
LQAGCEFYLGLYAGVAGLVLDPLEGFRLPGALGVVGVIAGMIKGLGGLAARPVVGLVDGSSKGLQGIGLLFLGKRGVQGKLVRRVRPPGAAAEDPLSRALRVRADGAGGREAAMRAALIASWQAAIGLLVPPLAGEAVVEVLAARHNRVVVLTAAHVVYLKAEPSRKAPPAAAAAARRGGAGGGGGGGEAGGSGAAGSMSYQLRWVLPCASVVHVRGSEESLRVWLEYYREIPRVRLTLRLNHQLRCANPTVYGSIVRRISRHVGLRFGAASGAAAAGGGSEDAAPLLLGAPPGWGPQQEAATGAARLEGGDGGVADLMIMGGGGGGGGGGASGSGGSGQIGGGGAGGVAAD